MSSIVVEGVDLVSLMASRKIDRLISIVRKMRSPEMLNKSDVDERCILWWASRYGIVQIVEALLELGALPNQCDSTSFRSPLMVAVEHGHTDIVIALLCLNDGDTSTSLVDIRGDTVLQIAVRANKYDILCLLLEHVNDEVVDWKNFVCTGQAFDFNPYIHCWITLRATLANTKYLQDRDSALDLAMISDNVPLVRVLLLAHASTGSDLFQRACRCGSVRVVQYFIAHSWAGATKHIAIILSQPRRFLGIKGDRDLEDRLTRARNRGMETRVRLRQELSACLNNLSGTWSLPSALVKFIVDYSLAPT